MKKTIFKKLNYRLVYEYIKRKEGKRITVKEISDETGLGQNSVTAALKYLKQMNIIDEGDPLNYFVTPESLTE